MTGRTIKPVLFNNVLDLVGQTTQDPDEQLTILAVSLVASCKMYEISFEEMVEQLRKTWRSVSRQDISIVKNAVQ